MEMGKGFGRGALDWIEWMGSILGKVLSFLLVGIVMVLGSEQSSGLNDEKGVYDTRLPAISHEFRLLRNHVSFSE